MKASIFSILQARSAADPIGALLGLALTYRVLCRAYIALSGRFAAGACFRISISIDETSAQEAT
jgi:hypothetical protein